MGTLKSMQKPKFKERSLKVSDEEWKGLQEKANQFTNGNVSAWLRYAGLHYVPSDEEQSPNAKV